MLAHLKMTKMKKMTAMKKMTTISTMTTMTTMTTDYKNDYNIYNDYNDYRLQSDNDLDSIRNSCHVFRVNLGSPKGPNGQNCDYLQQCFMITVKMNS